MQAEKVELTRKAKENLQRIAELDRAERRSAAELLSSKDANVALQKALEEGKEELQASVRAGEALKLKLHNTSEKLLSAQSENVRLSHRLEALQSQQAGTTRNIASMQATITDKEKALERMSTDMDRVSAEAEALVDSFRAGAARGSTIDIMLQPERSKRGSSVR